MLTDRQRETYDFIVQFIELQGYSPKLPEIAKGLRIRSIGVVHRYVQALIDKGLIDSVPHKHRGIRLNRRTPTNPKQIPLLGKIAAGRPIEAIYQAEPLDVGTLFANEDHYALRVQGNSMIDEGILDGDTIICKRCAGVDDGAIVVALIDNSEATLKRFKNNSDGTVTLIPANPHLTPQVYDAERVQIQGIFVGLVRMNKNNY